MMMDNEMNQ